MANIKINCSKGETFAAQICESNLLKNPLSCWQLFQNMVKGTSHWTFRNIKLATIQITIIQFYCNAQRVKWVAEVHLTIP
jgi:hypothetical protein